MKLLEQMRQTVADWIAPKSQNQPNEQPRSLPQSQNRRPLSQAEQKKLLDEVKGKVDAVNNDAADREDVINLAFLRGKQWVSWDNGKNRVYEPPKPKKRTRYVENRLIKIFMTNLARTFKSRVSMIVAPNSSDEEDLEAARKAEKYVDWLEYDKKLQQKDGRLVQWGNSTRIAFMHPYWNPSLGRLANPDTGAHEGDIDYDVLSCFEVKYDPAATCWDDVTWAEKCKVRTVDYVKQVYGEEVQAESGITQNNIYDAKMSFATPITGNVEYKPLDNVVRVKEFWEKPTVKYPNGRRVTYTSDKVLYVLDDIGFGPEDKEERILPFFPYVQIQLPGSVSGTNSIEQCRPIQFEHNRTRSQQIDSKDMSAYPVLAVQRGSTDDEIEGGVNKTWEYPEGGRPPNYVNPPQMSSDVYRMTDQNLAALDFISGQSQVSRGEVPSDASGYMVQLLMEQDDTTNAPSTDNYIDCKQAYMSYSLRMIRYRYTAERALRIVGRDNVETLSLKGSDLTSTDVRVQRGSFLATNKIAKRAEIANLTTMGYLSPERDREKVLRWSEFGSIDDVYNEAEQDIKQAKKEQVYWERGVFEGTSIIVRDFFNHPVHIEQHNRWRKSKKYETLPPEVQKIIDDHVAEHQMFMQQAAMQEMAMQAPTPQSAGTPHNPQNLEERIGNGEIIGNPMQGLDQPPPDPMPQ